MDVLYGVRMTGPLAPYASGLAGELARLGFTELSARCQLGLAAHLSRWLAAAGLGTAALTTPAAEAYLAARRAAGYTAYLTPRALAPLLGYLRELGVAPQTEIAGPATPAEVLLERRSVSGPARRERSTSRHIRPVAVVSHPARLAISGALDRLSRS
ncbi:MAG: hypothetical protein ACRDPY_50265, partial [Streptosporangiaceae bacterium]